MNVVVAVDKEWGIGYQNRLLIAIRADLRNFARLTKGKTVIYGSKTLETFPDKAPLKNRRNIILTRKPDLAAENAETAGSIEEVLSMVVKEDPENVFVIGGGSVYAQLLPYCDCCYVTKIEDSFEKDVFFENLDKNGAWELVYRSSEKKTDPDSDGTGDISYFFTKYRRKKDENEQKGK
ncbi:MAG: dihydrofolate reductase [Clostridia bacterium]|nr:dihydrofolate reductase [Clostridia bacterium]